MTQAAIVNRDACWHDGPLDRNTVSQGVMLFMALIRFIRKHRIIMH